MTRRDDLRALLPVADALDALGVKFFIGGSMASSVHGVSRSTIDIDLVADLRMEHAPALSARLAAEYYVDADQIRRAIESGGSFNLIHLATTYKIDVFIMGSRPFDVSAGRRAMMHALTDDDSPELRVASPEDTILSKLEWFSAGGEVSARQWSDVIGMIQVQGTQLDRTYLAHWARELGVDELLRRASEEAEG